MAKHYQADAQAVSTTGSRAVVWEAGSRDQCVEDGFSSQQHSRSRRDTNPNSIMRRVASSPGCHPLDQQVLSCHAMYSMQGGHEHCLLLRSVTLKRLFSAACKSQHTLWPWRPRPVSFRMSDCDLVAYVSEPGSRQPLHLPLPSVFTRIVFFLVRLTAPHHADWNGTCVSRIGICWQTV